jgi:hypothetical protein
MQTGNTLSSENPSHGPGCAHVAIQTIGFSYTSRCNYACEHCSIECGPERNEKLNADAVAARIEDAACLGIQRIAFTGGECLLYLEEILPLVRQATRNKQRATVISNGFWGASSEGASGVVSRLKDAGATQLEVSFDAFHANAGAKIGHVDNIAAACRRWGLRLKVVSIIRSAPSDKDRSILNELKVRKVTPAVGTVMPYGAAGKQLPIGQTYYHRRGVDKTPRCTSIGSMNYASNGYLLPCCGQGVCEVMNGPVTDHMILGHISEPLAAGLNRARNNLFLLIMAVSGPYGLVLLNEEYGNITTLPHEIYSVCDICILAARSESFRDLLAEMAKDREAIVGRIYDCYDFLHRWGLAQCELVPR